MSATSERPRSIRGKVIIAGPAGVGKTCLVERFVTDTYAAEDPAHGPTLGCDCHEKSVFVDNTEVHLYLYDTAGQERFAEMAKSYFRIGEVCLLCYDMSDLKTFDSTVWWHRKVTEHNAKCLFILVGTKEDKMSEQEKAKPEQEKGDHAKAMEKIAKWAEEKGIPSFRTSALQGGANVGFLFHTVAEKCLRLNRDQQLAAMDPTVRLAPTSIGHPKGPCCAG